MARDRSNISRVFQSCVSKQIIEDVKMWQECQRPTQLPNCLAYNNTVYKLIGH